MDDYECRILPFYAAVQPVINHYTLSLPALQPDY